MADVANVAESEIEVTPEMIEAGKEILLIRWAEIVDFQEEATFEEVAADIFRAMSEFRPSRQQPGRRTL